jgi:hypothetical protein
MGQSTDAMEYTADWTPVKRDINQGGQNIVMSFSANKVTMTAMGNTMDLTMNGAYINDGPGMDLLVAGLPLAEGYSLLFEMPDLATAKPKQMQLKVTGTDVINNKKNVFEKALLALVLISYIQPFSDGNKRTARIISNAILIQYHYCPLSFRTIDSIDYKKAMLIFYEQTNISPFKKIFINQFEFAVNTYF